MNIQTISQIITSRRNTLGWKQNELAEKSGVSVRQLSQLENGEGNPTFDNLMSILTTLGLTIQILDADDDMVSIPRKEIEKWF